MDQWILVFISHLIFCWWVARWCPFLQRRHETDAQQGL